MYVYCLPHGNIIYIHTHRSDDQQVHCCYAMQQVVASGDRQQVHCVRAKDVFAAGIRPRVDNYLTAVLYTSRGYTVIIYNIILYIICSRSRLVRGKV